MSPNSSITSRESEEFQAPTTTETFEEILRQEKG